MLKSKLLRFMFAASAALPLWGGVVGRVVQIGGHVSDIALDERRGVAYVANFTANRIEVVHTPDGTLLPPLKTPEQPATLALSPDGRYLVVGHYANWLPPSTAAPGITVLDLDAQTTVTYRPSASPLSIAFGPTNLGLLVAQDGFFLFDPATGVLQPLVMMGIGGKELPVPLATFPPEIVRASVGVSGNRQFAVGMAQLKQLGGEEFGDDDTKTLHYRYNFTTGLLELLGISSEPPLGPRVASVDLEGKTFVIGWALLDYRHVLLAQFPYPTGDFNVGGHAFDWLRGLIYAQVPESTYSGEQPTDLAPGAPPVPKLGPPVLHILDADNLTVRERLQLPENLAGKALLSADFQTLYGASDSGLMIIPIGSLDQYRRVVASQEDVLFHYGSCSQSVMHQEIDIIDPGGGATGFQITATGQGVTVAPSSGTTPATVRISADPAYFQNIKGTSEIFLKISSPAAINLPAPVRVLVNMNEPEQRGAIVNVPGKLVDILADPVRDRFYVLRQDKNQVQVYDGSSFTLTGILRTGNTPTQMAMTIDNRRLIVANDNSQIASVFDLDLLQPSEHIVFPFGHYPRSVAASHGAILAAVRGVGEPVGCPDGPGLHTIDRVDFETRTATTLPTLGVYCNDIALGTILTPSPDGRMIFAAMDDGRVLLYESDAGAFVVSREDFAALGGAFAALPEGVYAVDNFLLNRSLVPYATLETSSGHPSGFAFVDGMGLRTTAPSSSAPGVIQRVDLSQPALVIRPVKTVEAPLLVSAMAGPTVGQIGQTILPFTRTLAPLANRTAIVLLSTSGLATLPWNFDAAVAKPHIETVVNIADGSTELASGGMIAILGNGFSGVTASAAELPLPTTLGEACVAINGVPTPLFMVSPSQINAQIPFEVSGGAAIVVRSAGGVSDPYSFTVSSSSPAIFHTGTAGPDTGLPAIFRAVNNDLVTLSNPVHPGDYLTVYLAGLGRTSPEVASGAAAPYSPLAASVEVPHVTLGNVPLPVLYSGLVPGLVGVYQMNVYVPEQVPRGMQVPLNISRPAQPISLMLRVVK